MVSAARLRRAAEIASVRAHGRAVRRAAFVARVRRTDGTAVRLAVIAPGALGSSVVRNRMRRRVREAFRRAIARRGAVGGADILVTARREALAADFRQMEAEALEALAEAMS